MVPALSESGGLLQDGPIHMVPAAWLRMSLLPLIIEALLKDRATWHQWEHEPRIVIILGTVELSCLDEWTTSVTTSFRKLSWPRKMAVAR